MLTTVLKFNKPYLNITVQVVSFFMQQVEKTKLRTEQQKRTNTNKQIRLIHFNKMTKIQVQSLTENQ